MCPFPRIVSSLRRVVLRVLAKWPTREHRLIHMCRTPLQAIENLSSTYNNNNNNAATGRRNGTMAMSQRSHSAAPGENYRSSSPRRGSLSPPDDRYLDFPAHGSTGSQAYGSRFQSRSATATPTGSPKKRQLPAVPQSSRSANLRERLNQDFDERSGRFARYRMRQGPLPQTYRSTGMGGE